MTPVTSVNCDLSDIAIIEQVIIMDTTFTTGLNGFQQARSRMQTAAREIADESVDTDIPSTGSVNNITESLIELKAAGNDAKANLKVIETAADMIGTLLDVKT